MTRKLLSPFHCLGVFLLLTCFWYAPAVIADQKICAPPPLVQSVAVSQPNVLFVLGNGVTMGEYAYSSTFDPGRKYYGYFDPDKVYKYRNYPKHYFEPVGDAVDDPSTSIKERAAGLKNEPLKKVFSGNWLNWLTMRRMDIAKKVITGGRLGGDPTEYVLVGDTLAYQNHNEGDHWTRSFVDADKKGKLYYTPFYTGSNDVNLLVAFSTFDRTHRPDGKVKFVPLFKITLGNTVVSGDASYENQGATAFMGVDFRSSPYPEQIIQCTNPAISPGSPTNLHCAGAGAASCEADYWQTKGQCASYPCDDTKILNETWVKDLQFRCGSYYVAVKAGDVVDSATGKLLDPPQGVIQKVTGRVRLGFMRYNTGWGPADTNPPGGQGDYYNNLSYDWTINGRIDYVARLSDGGQVLVPVGKPQYVDSNQQYTDSNGVTQKVQALKLVDKINESHPQGFTPVAETIKEAMLYYQQKPPCYKSDCDPDSNSTDTLHGWCLTGQVKDFEVSNEWDPFYDMDYTQKIACGQNHIIFLTDGDPLKNAKADEGAGTCSTGESVTLTKSATADDSGTLLDDVTFTMHTQDMRSDIAGKQTIKFHAVQCFDTTDAPGLISAAKSGGFNDADESGDITNSGEWDSNGDGLPDNFYKAEDGYQLEQELLAIFTEISAQGSGGAVATVSQETRAGDLIVRGAFFHKVNASRTKGIWNGHLETWWPDDSGTYDFERFGLSFCADIITGEGQKHCWDAGEFLTTATADKRLILTLLEQAGAASGGTKPWNKPEVFEFNTANSAILESFLELSPTSLNKTNDLIKWIRGNVDGNGQPLAQADMTISYRDRKQDLDSGNQWLLGDIIYSTPVVVGSPSLASAVPGSPNYEEYLTYRANNFYRSRMVYVGGNDGMLHAFLLARWHDGDKVWVHDPKDDRCKDCGKEIWAYIPSSLLPDLQKLSKTAYGTSVCQHIAMVDLAPQAFDVYIDHDGDGTREWRTIVIGGLRGGGDSYFAIDVTEPPVPVTPGDDHTWDKTANPNPRILWEFSVLKNMAVAYEDTSTSPSKVKIARPYAGPDLYSRLRDLSLSWSEPAVGRMIIPQGVQFAVHHPVYAPDAGASTPIAAKAPNWKREPVSFTNLTKYRHVAFIGGGFRIFQQPNWDGMALYPSPDEQDTRQGLFKPNLLAIDVETGYNLFQEVWPLLTKYAPYNKWSGSTPTEILWDIKKVTDPPSPTPVERTTIPYSVSHVIAVDACSQTKDANGVVKETCTSREDGFVDRLYFGDMYGFFYALKFDYDDKGATDGSLFAKLEMRRTKQVTTANPPADPLNPGKTDLVNYYRYLTQPITGKFGATWDANKTGLTIAFGTGKLDDDHGGNDDIKDIGVMSAYAARDPVQAVTPIDSSLKEEVNLSVNPTAGIEVTPKPNPDPSGKAMRVTIASSDGAAVTGSNFAMEVSQLTCPGTGNSNTFGPDPLTSPCTENASGTRTNCNNWAIKVAGTNIGDCAEREEPPTSGDCVLTASYTPCWDCVYDFSTPGERVIDRPLIAGGLIFFSTAIPPVDKNPCDVAEGTGNLYVFDYGCRPFPEGFVVVTPDGTMTVVPITNEAGEKIGEKVSFPGTSGVPSRPILDSSGENVLIQKSNSELVKIPVNLIVKTTQVTGFRER